MLFGGVGGLQHGANVRLASFRLAGTVLPNQITTLSLATAGTLGSTPLAGNVGEDILRRFVFTVDYPGKRVDFTPNADVTAREPYRRTGLSSMRQADGTFKVIAVIPGSAGAAAGIHVGDELVSIDGRLAAHLDRVQIEETLRAPSVTYGVRSDGTQRDVTIALKELLGDRDRRD